MEEERKKTKEEKKSVELKVVTLIPTVTLVAITTTITVPSDDDDDHKGIMSSLSKLLQKTKFVKSLEKTLTKVLDII